mmetsp:Transcript_2600/g.4043  ORF Transcript_2600/g.4043 Transcript_2600/m.4043 type:complete len:100 (+) Transcript_2600:172-471(+)
MSSETWSSFHSKHGSERLPYASSDGVIHSSMVSCPRQPRKQHCLLGCLSALMGRSSKGRHPSSSINNNHVDSPTISHHYHESVGDLGYNFPGDETKLVE